MIWLISISCAICFSYIIFILTKTVPESLSATNYMFKKKYFRPYCVLVAMTLLPPWLEITDGYNCQFLAFLACAGLLFVGGSADYREDKFVYNLHFICAYIACLASIIGIIVLTSFWYLVLIIPAGMLIIALTLGIEKTWVFWLEVFVFFIVYLSLFLEYL